MLDSLAYRTARSHVHAFAGESEEIVARHYQAMKCRDCESFLQLGIDAFNWLSRADTEIRKAIFSGLVQHDPQVDLAIDGLYRTWLRPCGVAEEWIATQIERGFELDNLDEFRKCVVEVRAIVGENSEVSGELAEMRDRAIECHKRGESLEWETASSEVPFSDEWAREIERRVAELDAGTAETTPWSQVREKALAYGGDHAGG